MAFSATLYAKPHESIRPFFCTPFDRRRGLAGGACAAAVARNDPGGDLPGGARIAELTLVERLGVSRTPIREALLRLEQEGLLHGLPSGGYAVRTFSETDVADAIELRGTMEGLAARLAAERGADALLLAQAAQCLDAIDQVLQPQALDDDGFARYVALNAQFHHLLARMVGSDLVVRELERIKKPAVCLALGLCGGADPFQRGPRHAGDCPRPPPPGAGRH